MTKGWAKGDELEKQYLESDEFEKDVEEAKEQYLFQMLDQYIAPVLRQRPPRDPARIDRVLELLGELWKLQPDTRFCQLIINTVGAQRDPYDLEDDVLVEDLKENIERMRQFHKNRENK